MISATAMKKQVGALHPRWQLCLLLSAIATVIARLPHGAEFMRYERFAIAHGQLWRLATGHLAHVNSMHLLLNVCGLMLLCELLWRGMPARHVVGTLLISAFTVSGGLWWLAPQVHWYAGLSAILHGLWAALAFWTVTSTPSQRPKDMRDTPVFAATVLLALALKLIADALAHTSAFSAVIGSPVLTWSHACGALGGLAYVLSVRTAAAWSAMRPQGSTPPAHLV